MAASYLAAARAIAAELRDRERRECEELSRLPLARMAELVRYDAEMRVAERLRDK